MVSRTEFSSATSKPDTHRIVVQTVARDQSDLSFVAFALSDCTVKTDPQAAKYLRAVHRTALELAVPNYFGVKVGGYWLLEEQIASLRALPGHYPANEAPAVARAVSAYLKAQLPEQGLSNACFKSPKNPEPMLLPDLPSSVF